MWFLLLDRHELISGTQDLRVWTIFRAEVAHFKTQHVAYRKTGMEWEILGDLGLRLHHKEEAKEAYQRCLDSPRYSAKPWMKLLDMYAEESDIQRTLQVAIRVAAYQYGEYTEMTVRCLITCMLRRDIDFSCACVVPDTDRAVPVQARPDPRPRQNLVYSDEHGSPGRGAQDHGELHAIREDL